MHVLTIKLTADPEQADFVPADLAPRMEALIGAAFTELLADGILAVTVDRPAQVDPDKAATLRAKRREYIKKRRANDPAFRERERVYLKKWRAARKAK